MKTSETQIKVLGIGLKKARAQRILEEYRSDAQQDSNAKRAAILRLLRSYFWVSNLSAPLVFFIGAIGLIAALKSIWIWASCLVLISLFITKSSAEENFAFKTFKVYKLSLGVLALVSCYYSLKFDNTGEWGLIHNLDFYFGNAVYIVGGAIASVTLIALVIEFFKSKSKFIQLQRLSFVVCTTVIYLSSNYTAPYPYRYSYLIQVSLTAFLFVGTLIKRKPALA